MITEDYVSFEIAKLLKEKGFDEPCSCYYQDDTVAGEGIKFNSWPDKPSSNSDIGRRYSAPTLQMTMRWLREVHKLGVFPSTYTNIFGSGTTHVYDTAIVNLNTYELMTVDCLARDTYNDACEAAIKYCLENNLDMAKEIEIPEGCEAKIEGNKVVFVQKESEDEKIRKAISYAIGTATHQDGTLINDVTKDEALAWLEKQKEQKPAEYEKPLLSKFERAVYDCAWDKVTCKPEGETQEEYAKRWAWHLLLMVRDWADDYIDTQIESAKRKSYDKGKADAEKPAEWSKEDEEKIDDIITIICDARECSKIAKIGEEKEDNSAFYDRLVLFLKSLHPQPKQEWSEEDHDYYDAIIAKLEVTQDDAMLTDQQMSFLKSIPEKLNLQPKQEWSKEDEQYLLVCKNALNKYQRSDHWDATIILTWLENRLKSLRPQPKAEWSEGTKKALDEISDYLKYRGMEDEADFIRYLRPQPHWKPSDEQMKMLKEVIDRALLTCRQQGPLEELYKDLQKLL